MTPHPKPRRAEFRIDWLIHIFQRFWRLLGLILFLMGAVVTLREFSPIIISSLPSPEAPKDAVILVADFEGSDGDAIAGNIYDELNNTVESIGLDDSIDIHRIRDVAFSADEDAFAAGQQNKATMVIWGRYSNDLWIKPRYTLIKHQDVLRPNVAIDELENEHPSFDAYINEGITTDFDYVILFLAGLISYQNEEYHQAIDLFDRALSLDFDENRRNLSLNTLYFYRAEANRRLGELASADQNFSESEKYYRQAIESYNQSVQRKVSYEAYKHRGVVYYYLENYEQAVVDYTYALELIPNDSDLLNNRGLAFADFGNAEKALEDYNQALVSNPDNYRARINRGVLLADMGDFELAIADYQYVVEAPENDFLYLALNNWADVLNRFTMRFEEAKNIASESISLNPFFAESYHTRGMSNLLLNNTQEATADFSEALELNPTLPHVYRDLGRAYLIEGQLEQALERLQQANEMYEGEDADTLYFQGQVYQQLNNPEKARESYLGFLDLAADGDVRMPEVSNWLNQN
jgi:tetratricopeptide (TPR) repeat protein